MEGASEVSGTLGLEVEVVLGKVAVVLGLLFVGDEQPARRRMAMSRQDDKGKKVIFWFDLV